VLRGEGFAEMSADEEGINRRQFYYEVIYTLRTECCCWSLWLLRGMEYLRAATRQDPAAAAAGATRERRSAQQESVMIMLCVSICVVVDWWKKERKKSLVSSVSK
jgi:hypothetical protein